MERAINILQKELNVLNNRVQYESNRQVGNDLDESIYQIKKAIKTLQSDWSELVQNIPDEQQINMESILQCSKTEGSEILSQVYFRKGANYVRTVLLESI